MRPGEVTRQLAADMPRTLPASARGELFQPLKHLQLVFILTGTAPGARTGGFSARLHERAGLHLHPERVGDGVYILVAPTAESEQDDLLPVQLRGELGHMVHRV